MDTKTEIFDERLKDDEIAGGERFSEIRQTEVNLVKLFWSKLQSQFPQTVPLAVFNTRSLSRIRNFSEISLHSRDMADSVFVFTRVKYDKNNDVLEVYKTPQAQDEALEYALMDFFRIQNAEIGHFYKNGYSFSYADLKLVQF